MHILKCMTKSKYSIITSLKDNKRGTREKLKNGISQAVDEVLYKRKLVPKKLKKKQDSSQKRQTLSGSCRNLDLKEVKKDKMNLMEIKFGGVGRDK